MKIPGASKAEHRRLTVSLSDISGSAPDGGALQDSSPGLGHSRKTNVGAHIRESPWSWVRSKFRLLLHPSNKLNAPSTSPAAPGWVEDEEHTSQPPPGDSDDEPHSSSRMYRHSLTAQEALQPRHQPHCSSKSAPLPRLPLPSESPLSRPLINQPSHLLPTLAHESSRSQLLDPQLRCVVGPRLASSRGLQLLMRMGTATASRRASNAASAFTAARRCRVVPEGPPARRVASQREAAEEGAGEEEVEARWSLPGTPSSIGTMREIMHHRWSESQMSTPVSVLPHSYLAASASDSGPRRAAGHGSGWTSEPLPRLPAAGCRPPVQCDGSAAACPSGDSANLNVIQQGRHSEGLQRRIPPGTSSSLKDLRRPGVCLRRISSYAQQRSSRLCSTTNRLAESTEP